MIITIQAHTLPLSTYKEKGGRINLVEHSKGVLLALVTGSAPVVEYSPILPGWIGERHPLPRSHPLHTQLSLHTLVSLNCTYVFPLTL